MGNPLINELGNKYGSLTVIKLTKDKNGRTAWLCQCDCGNTKIVRGPDLRKNKVTHCSKNCPCKISPKFINEEGNQYGELIVLYKSPFKSNSQKTLWHCQCSCGNEIDVLGESLRQGLTKSCGCQTKTMIAKSKSLDLTNQQFGYLIPLEIIEYGQGHGAGNIWRCKCLCGCGREDVLVPTHRLTSNNTQSCGRIRRSHGEIAIENFLKEKNINFQVEYSFNELHSEKFRHIKLRYDFAIFDKNNNLFCLIEFDGQQHFEPIEYFGGQKGFEKRVMYDNIKNSYCKENNISLIRIKYDENIESKLKENFEGVLYNNED